jgi:hypothetical protein
MRIGILEEPLGSRPRIGLTDNAQHLLQSISYIYASSSPSSSGCLNLQTRSPIKTMPNLKFPSNPTSYRRTGWQIALMLLMGMNYLLDHDPRHVQYGKDQRAKHKAKKSRYKSGFVVELPDAHDKHASNPSSADATRSQEARLPSPCQVPPPVSRDGKDPWPYPRGSNPDTRGPSRRGSKPTGRMPMKDAWTRMRAVTKAPYEHVRRGDGRKKRVTFNRNVQWFVFDSDECSYGGGYVENVRGRR